MQGTRPVAGCRAAPCLNRAGRDLVALLQKPVLRGGLFCGRAAARPRWTQRLGNGYVGLRGGRPMDSPDSTLQTAFQMCQQGQFEQARPLLLQVLEHDPKELNALQLLGTVAYQGRDLEGAAAWYRRALAVEDEPTLHYNLALVLEDQHRLNEAEAEYRAALKRHPSFAPAWNNLGSVLRRKGLLQQAEQCYRRVLGFKPGVAGHHANLARVLQDQGRRDEALASYRRVLEIDPNDATARYMVAAFTGSENPAAP